MAAKTMPVATADTALPPGVIARIPLRHAIEDQEGKLHDVLEIKEPTTDDYIQNGDPYLMIPKDGGMAIEANPRVGLAYLQSCTGIHSPFLRKMHMYDMMKSVGAIANFFAQA